VETRRKEFSRKEPSAANTTFFGVKMSFLRSAR
jgi:hypothetical protein